MIQFEKEKVNVYHVAFNICISVDGTVVQQYGDVRVMGEHFDLVRTREKLKKDFLEVWPKVKITIFSWQKLTEEERKLWEQDNET